MKHQPTFITEMLTTWLTFQLNSIRI